MTGVLFVMFVALLNVGFGFVAAVFLGDGPSVPVFREFCREWLPFDVFDEVDAYRDERLDTELDDRTPDENASAEVASAGEYDG